MMRRWILMLLVLAGIAWPQDEPTPKERAAQVTDAFQAETKRRAGAKTAADEAEGSYQELRSRYAEGRRLSKESVLARMAELRHETGSALVDRAMAEVDRKLDAYEDERDVVALRLSEHPEEAALHALRERLDSVIEALRGSRAEMTRYLEAKRKSLFLLRRENLLLRGTSPITGAALTRGAKDLKRLPSWFGRATRTARDYVAGHGGALVRWLGVSLAAVLILFLARRSARAWHRRKDRPVTETVALVADAVARAGLWFLPLWLAARILPDLPRGFPAWLTSTSYVAGIVSLGFSFCRSLTHFGIAEEPARRLARGLRLMLLISAVALPVQYALAHAGYRNVGMIELFDLTRRVLVGAIALSIVARRSFLLSLVPNPEKGPGRIIALLFRVFQPVLVVLIPAIVVLRILRFDLLSSMLTTHVLAAVGASLASALLFRLARQGTDAWAARLYPAQTMPNRHKATASALRFVAGLVVAFIGLGLFLVFAGSSMTELRETFDVPLPFMAKDGANVTTWWDLIVAGFLLFLFLAGTKHAKQILHDVVLRQTKWDGGLKYTISTLSGYALVTLGVYVAITRVFDLSSFGTILAALSVGIGFGLQEVISNFVSGLILLFERPLKVGDMVNVGGTEGIVKNINIRASTILTNDNIYLLVPNKEFISQTVTNYRHNDPKMRLHIGVGVSYSTTDTARVKEVLLEVAAAHEEVLKHPAPDVWFKEFGDSSINFELLGWIAEPRRKNPVSSQLTFAIFDALNKHGIEIPFPQRDLHLRSAEVVRVASEG